MSNARQARTLAIGTQTRKENVLPTLLTMMSIKRPAKGARATALRFCMPHLTLLFCPWRGWLFSDPPHHCLHVPTSTRASSIYV
jgi:hypothetical protein